MKFTLYTLLLFLGISFSAKNVWCQGDCPLLDLRLDKLTCQDVTVFWRPPAGINSYEVKYTNLNNNWDSTFTTSHTSAYLLLPQGGATYRVEVTYFCGSRPVVSRTEFTAPLCPIRCPEPIVRVNDVKCDKISISWELIPEVYDYVVKYNEKGSTQVTTLTVNANSAVLTASGGKTYEVTVSYLCEGKDAQKTIEVTTPECPKPCPIPQVRVDSVSCNRAIISWSPTGSEPQTYEVTYWGMSDSSSSRFEVGTNRAELRLLPSQTYFVNVSYLCNGQRVTSPPTTIVTPSCTIPCAPPRVRIERVSCDKVVLSWQASTNNPGPYTITYRSANSNTSESIEVNGTRAELTLQPQTTYTIQISYMCGRQRVTSPPLTVTTPPCAPSCEPLQVRTETVSCERIVLSWNNVTTTPNQVYLVSVYTSNDSFPRTLTTPLPRIQIPATPSTVYFIEVTYLCNNQRITTPIKVETPACPIPCPRLEVREELVTCERVVIAWNPVQGIREYEVTYTAANDSNSQTIRTNIPGANFSVTPNTPYKIEVSYTCNGQKVTTSLEIKTPSCPMPCPRLLIKPIEVTCQSAKLAWEPIPGINTYQVTLRSPRDSSTRSLTVEEPSVTLTSLQPNQPYLVEISYTCNGQSMVTPYTFITPACPAPSCPQLEIKTESLTCERVVLVWQSIAGVANYVVSYRSSSDSLPLVAVVNTNQASIAVRPSTTYRGEIIYLCGNQRIITPFEFTTPTCPIPCTRLRISAENVTCESATLRWNAVGAGIEYTVTYTLIGPNPSPQSVTVTTNSVTLQLQPSSVYAITVSYPCNGQKLETPYQLQTPACPIPCPDLSIRIENLACDRATVTWQAIPGVNFYLVSIMRVGDSTALPPVTVPTTSFPLNNLQPQTGYRVEVAYVCNGRRVAGSVEFKTPACPIPCPRPVIRPTNVTCESVTLSWEPLPGVSSYTITYNAVGDSNTTTIRATTSPITLNLKPDTPYLIVISYECNGETISTPFQIRTPACPPQCPQLRIAPLRINCDTATFTWNPVGINTTYTVTLRKEGDAAGLTFNTNTNTINLPVQASTAYRLEVAYICNGQRIVSNFSFTTPACQVPCGRLNIRIDSLNCKGANISWAGASGSNITYTIVVRKVSSQPIITPPRTLTTRNNSIYVGDLDENSNYRVEITYLCNGQRIVSTAEFQTPPCQPRSKQSNCSEAFNINVYPNPSKGLVNINLPQPQNATLQLFSNTGELIASYSIDAQSIELDLSHLPKGLYLLLFTNQETKGWHKLLLE
ncbi:MAG: T9SS type A sorting domain-containing protein [Bacteroidia bacterium]|nr:T9SS type A sorting domain-containing protein [Bacteroidia bacterium]